MNNVRLLALAFNTSLSKIEDWKEAVEIAEDPSRYSDEDVECMREAILAISTFMNYTSLSGVNISELQNVTDYDGLWDNDKLYSVGGNDE